MRVKSVIIALVGFGISSIGWAESPPRYQALFDQIWHTVQDNFYDPGFHGLDWRAVGDRYRAKLAGVHDDQSFQALTMAMLGELHASHVSLAPPVENQVIGGVGIGAGFERIGEELVVVDVAPLSDAQRQGLRSGDRTAAGTLRGPLGATSEIEITGCGGVRRKLALRHEFTAWPPPQPTFSWRQITIRPGVKFGYIRAERFDDGAAALADQAMKDLKDTQALVIDVRGNGGGNLSAARLISYFAGPSKPIAALFSRVYLARLGHAPTKADIDRLTPTRGAYTTADVFAAVKQGNGAAVFYSEDLGPQRYTGRVVVVTDGRTASAGEAFAAAMRDLAAATLIGRPTAGYLLSSDRFPLAKGWTLTIPVDGVWAPDGRDLGDKPTIPDITTSRSVADICTAHDRDLDRAVDVLEGKPKG